MTKVEKFNSIIRSQTDEDLEKLYAEAMRRIQDDCADTVAAAIESEYARRHGWEACEAMTDIVAA